MNNIESSNNLGIVNEKNDISVELICSSVLSFVKKLPYSIDPMHEEFIPGFLFNVIPNNFEKYSAFNEDDGITLFSIMKNWRDTRKAAYSIQICVILQSMLLDDKEIDIEANDNTIMGLGIEDSDRLKETLYKLNNYFKLIKNSSSNEEREKYIEEFYQIIKLNYSNCSAYNDLKMFYYFFNLPSDTDFIWKQEPSNITEQKIKIMSKIKD